jgi:hypothetical protein
MTFQIHALPRSGFEPLFAMTDAELAARGARRMTVTERPGFPCRVSLEDAEPGESVLLVNYEHQPNPTPYRSSHAIFVREGARQAFPEPGELPDVLARRLISARAFDASHDMRDADVVEGRDLAALIERLFADPRVDYLDLHNAKRGCFAARATRAASAIR